MRKVYKGSAINVSSRTLGEKTFAAIAAVEGLKLGPVSAKRLSSLKERNLTPAQKRAEVLRAYIGSKGR